MNAPGIIRKISIGDIKEGITYKLHQSMMGGRIYIEQILQDLDYIENYGILKYDVYVSENGSDNIRVWKSFSNAEVAIEYDISVSNETP